MSTVSVPSEDKGFGQSHSLPDGPSKGQSQPLRSCTGLDGQRCGKFIAAWDDHPFCVSCRARSGTPCDGSHSCPVCVAWPADTREKFVRPQARRQAKRKKPHVPTTVNEDQDLESASQAAARVPAASPTPSLTSLLASPSTDPTQQLLASLSQLPSILLQRDQSTAADSTAAWVRSQVAIQTTGTATPITIITRLQARPPNTPFQGPRLLFPRSTHKPAMPSANPSTRTAGPQGSKRRCSPSPTINVDGESSDDCSRREYRSGLV